LSPWKLKREAMFCYEYISDSKLLRISIKVCILGIQQKLPGEFNLVVIEMVLRILGWTGKMIS